MLKIRSYIALLVVGIAIQGCGNGPKLANVHGTVTLDGKPVPNASVTFVPKDAVLRSPSYGTTDSKGNYTLQFSRDRYGALLAEHNVQIETEKVTKAELQELKAAEAAGGPPVPEFVMVPRKYANTGALTAQVARGKNEINFELTIK